jgi:hypothetical protein
MELVERRSPRLGTGAAGIDQGPVDVEQDCDVLVPVPIEEAR